MPAICVGVDAGGSAAVAAAAYEGERRVRTFVGGPANPRVCGIERAADAIASAIEGVLDGRRAAAIAVGAAGAGREETRAALLAALVGRFRDARVAVTDDAHVALRGAIPTGDGIVLVAGTGSIAYAEIGESRMRAGGYGYLLGDAGSGLAIGAAALRLLLQSYEKRVPGGAMLAALAEQLGARGASDAIECVYSDPSPVTAVAACAPLVLAHAAAGERSASKIVQTAALDLFDLLKSLVTMSEAPPVILSGAPEGRAVEGRELPLAFSGGLLRENNALTYLLETRIANEFPNLRIVKGGGEPYLGALAEARALLV